MENFEKAIIDAIANQFFSSAVSHTDQNGTTYYSGSPALRIAQQLFEAHKGEIYEAVREKLDVEDFGGKIAERLFEHLKGTSFSNWNNDKVQAEVRVKVIEKLADIQVKTMLEAGKSGN